MALWTASGYVYSKAGTGLSGKTVNAYRIDTNALAATTTTGAGGVWSIPNLDTTLQYRIEIIDTASSKLIRTRFSGEMGDLYVAGQALLPTNTYQNGTLLSAIYAPLASPTFTGTLTAATITASGTVTGGNLTTAGTVTGATGSFSGAVSAVGLSSSSGLTVSVGTSALQAITGTTLGLTGALTGTSAAFSAGVTVGTTLGVTGNTSLSTLSTSGLATLNSVSVTGAATVGTTLGVTGATTLAGLSATTGTFSGLITANAGLSGTTVTTTGLLTAGNGLTVSAGTSNLKNTAITGTLTVSSTLTVSGDTTVSGNLVANGPNLNVIGQLNVNPGNHFLQGIINFQPNVSTDTPIKMLQAASQSARMLTIYDSTGSTFKFALGHDGRFVVSNHVASTTTPSGAIAYKLPIYADNGAGANTFIGHIPIYASL